jgi:hypothetical protein
MVYFLETQFEIGDRVKHKTHSTMHYIVVGYLAHNAVDKNRLVNYSVSCSDCVGQIKYFYPFELEPALEEVYEHTPDE